MRRSTTIHLFIIAIFLLVAGVVLFVSNIVQNMQQEAAGTEAETESETEEAMLTLEDVLNAEESPESDFSIAATADNCCTITAYNGSGGIVVIPGAIKGCTVTAIAALAFSDEHGENVQAVRLPDTVTTIKDGGAFALNSTLEIFVAGNGLESIGKNTFLSCTGLKVVELNEGLLSIGEGAFMYCSEIAELEIPSTVEAMGDGSLAGLSANLILYGKADSAVAEYARDNGLNFEGIYG